MIRVAVATLGCKVNHYESAGIIEALTSQGFSVVPFDSPADLYIVNTCTITANFVRLGGPPPALVPVNGWQMLLLMMGLLLGGAFIALRRGG